MCLIYIKIPRSTLLDDIIVNGFLFSGFFFKSAWSCYNFSGYRGKYNNVFLTEYFGY